MAVDWLYIMKETRCNRLAFLCCMDAPQLQRAVDLLRDATPDEIEEVRQYVCQCEPGGGGGGGTTPPPVEPSTVTECQKAATAYFCSQEGQTTIGAMQAFLTVASGIATVAGSEEYKKVADAFELVLNLIEQHCAGGTDSFPPAAMTGLCTATHALEAYIGSLGEPNATLLRTAWGAALPEKLQALLANCCK